MKKTKKIIIIGLIVLLVVILIGEYIPSSNEKASNKAELAALRFIESMLDGDADECVDLMCEDLISLSNYETKKLFIHDFDKKLDILIDNYKEKYGSRWKHEVVIIDSYDYQLNSDEDFDDSESDLMKVVLEIKHEGRGIFKEKEGAEEVQLIMKNTDGQWLVYDFYIND